MNRVVWTGGKKQPPIVRHPDDEKRDRIHEAVSMAVGHASMCWDPRPSHEVFDSTEAKQVVDTLLTTIYKEMDI